MITQAPKTGRVFKTAWFSRAARKARIQDEKLCEAIEQVMKGLTDGLGGGVLKKRLNKNMHRAIVLIKGSEFWIYEYLFAKKDRANIDKDELAGFRRLARSYETLTDRQIAALIGGGDFLEICHDG